MAKKIGVLDAHQCADSQPQCYLPKSVAKVMVRRLFAEWIVKNVTIRRRVIRTTEEIAKGYIAMPRQIPSWAREGYQHHLEPKIEHLHAGNSDWMAYLEGYRAQLDTP